MMPKLLKFGLISTVSCCSNVIVRPRYFAHSFTGNTSTLMLSIDTSVLLSLVAENFRFIQVAFQSHALGAFLEVTHHAPELFQ